MLPDKRLSMAAALVRQGAVFADIGTDHAYLPVFLCESKKISRAIAADIHEGPLETAKKHITAHGLSHMIRTHLANGLAGLEKEGLTDIAICGMGGELIVSILSAAPFVKSKDIRLILQPMTHGADLRHYLAREGFAIEEEQVARAAGKYYTCIAACYTGIPYTLTDAEALLGKYLLAHLGENADFLALLAEQKKRQEKKCKGLRQGGKRDEREEALLLTLTTLCKTKAERNIP